jgi:hypothetical protein
MRNDLRISSLSLMLGLAANLAWGAPPEAKPAAAKTEKVEAKSEKAEKKAEPKPAAARPKLTAGIFRTEQLPGVIVDDRDAEVTGEWTRSAVVVPYVADGYLHDSNKDKGKKTIRFTADLPAAGMYEVRIVYSAGDNRATNTPFTVETADGPKKVLVNQRLSPEIERAFHPLGSFRFAAGKAVVTVTNDETDGHVIADAVQFLSKTDLEALAAKVAKPVKPEVVKPEPKADPTKVATKEDPKKEEPKKQPEKPVVVRPVVNLPKLTSAQLDTMLDEALPDQLKDLVNDEQFLRRVTLDLIGRQPTLAEAVAWSAETAADKRPQLIERLLASPEFGRNWANYWSDTISYRTPPPELTYLKYEPFKDWLAEKLNKSVAWDEITRDILTASGKISENPPATFVGYHQADATRLAAETARIFLGQQIRCAECHDHPFDHWKREEFHRLTAFYARSGAKLPWRDGPATVVSDKGKGEHVMPDAQDPKKKGQVMTPAFLTEQGLTEGASDSERRTALARLITSPENPWFSQSFTNRMWSRLMGRGFYEPVDDMADHQQPLLPKVHQAISDSFTAHNFDTKHVFRVVMNSRAYQRTLRPGETADQRPFLAAAPARLRGDEVFDSLVSALAIPNVTPPETPHSDAIRFPPPPKSTRDLVVEAFGFDPSLAVKDIPRTMAQAMLLMNNPQVQAQVKAAPDSGTELAKLLAEVKDDKQAVVRLFERTLARKPTENELKISLKHVEQIGNRSEAFEDLLWGLLNSAEFTTRR